MGAISGSGWYESCISHYDMSGGMSSSDLTDDDYANLALTRRLIRRYLAFSERAAESAGLEPQHYQLLLMLRGLTPRGGAGVSDLSDWLQIRHHSAVELVDRLSEAGLVRRIPDANDQRRVLLSLTDLADGYLAELSAAHLDELSRIKPILNRILTRSTG